MIELTQLEFTLLLDNDHPLYDASAKDKFFETGKGSDIHYTRKIIRLSDQTELSILFTYNSQLGSYQDWIRGGDFDLNHEKEDIYNEQGELIAEETPTEEPETKEPTPEEIHTQMVKDGIIPKFEDTEWQKISSEKIKELLILSKNVRYSEPEDRKCSLEDLASLFFKYSIEEKVNADSVWQALFQNEKNLKMPMKKFLERYRMEQELIVKKSVTFKLESGEIELTYKDLKNLDLASSLFFNDK